MANEWIEWGGGACPVADETIVDVRFRGGDSDLESYAIDWDWSDGDHEYDIVAYRIVKPSTPLTPRAQFDAASPLQEELAINISAQIANGVRPDAVQVLEWAAALYEAEVGAA